MDLTVLKGEVLADPLGLGYAAHLPDSPGLVVDLLNAQTQSMVKPMTASRALVWAAQGPYAAIVDTGNNATHPARSSCMAFRDNVLAGRDVDMGDPAVQAEFNEWVSAGIITDAQRALAIQYATQPASRAEVLGLGAVTINDLIDAGVIQ